MLDTEKRPFNIDESLFTSEQLDELRIGQERSLPIHLYANPMYTPAEMAAYRTFLDTSGAYASGNSGRYVVTETGPQEASYGFKSRSNFEKHPERVCYVPENWDFEEGPGYSARDFLDLCDGDKIKAGIVFDLCGWEHPETVLDQWDHDDDLALAEMKEKKIHQLQAEIFDLLQDREDAAPAFQPDDTAVTPKQEEKDSVLYQIDSRNYVEKVPHPSDPFEDYYRYVLNGDFMGGVCNKHIISIHRTGKPDIEAVEQQIIRSFTEMYTAREGHRRDTLKNMSPDAFRAFLRTLQENPYNWPNRYFAWQKPDGTLMMIGLASTQMYHMIKRDFYQSETQIKFGLPGEYVARLYGISPGVTYMQNNVKYDPVEKLVDEIRGYRYLGYWDDPDILMSDPRSFNRVLAHGRWDLAREHILGREQKLSLSEQISDAAGRTGNPPPTKTAATPER